MFKFNPEGLSEEEQMAQLALLMQSESQN